MKALETLIDRAGNIHDVHQGICDAYPRQLSYFRGMTPMPTAPVATTAACLRDAYARDPDLLRDDGRPIRVLIAGAQIPETLENCRLWGLLPILANLQRSIEVFLVGPEVDDIKALSANSASAIPAALFPISPSCDVRTFNGSCGEFFDSGVDPAFDLCCAYSPGFVILGGSWFLSGDIDRIFATSRHIYTSANPGIDTIADRALFHSMGCQIEITSFPDFSLGLGHWPDPNAQWLCHEVCRVERPVGIKTPSDPDIKHLAAGMAMPLAIGVESEEFETPPFFRPTRSTLTDCNYYSLNHWLAMAWRGDQFSLVQYLGGEKFLPLCSSTAIPPTAITTATGCWDILQVLSGELGASEFGEEVLNQVMLGWAVGVDRASQSSL